jgi:hypothetical protein
MGTEAAQRSVITGSPVVTKNPNFFKADEIEQENQYRNMIMGYLLTRGADEIRNMIKTSGAEGGGVALGTIIPIWEGYLIRPADEPAFRGLIESYKNLGSDPDEIKKKINVLLARGSDFIRTTVINAAKWVEIPPALVAVALLWENDVNNRAHHGLQTLERDFTALLDRFNLPGGGGSTGLGNVKAETLEIAVSHFEQYYKRTALPPEISNTGRGRLVETDIYHVALVMRECLNHTWSQGTTSLRESEAGRYVYFPYFGGQLTNEDVIRTIGRYNGFGDKARNYGTNAADYISKGYPNVFLRK